MKNINLNPGGVIGALVVGIGAGIAVFGFADPQGSRGPFKLLALAFVGGAFAGNWLWGLVFTKPEPPTEPGQRDATSDGPESV